ncbi:protein translocase subunit SecF [Polyangium sp. y55x31]|uniref:protein translocase subunit SecF n=1 Tax=Polyangium sp. y55x31 TaxID=3042688 RepID=UPI0024828080|nr:protein translocase subunit SecF [Polyangium sp. y55x31]MDI1475867.1 protein translocase subunit SecF [Polyangium sp. y55x31]
MEFIKPGQQFDFMSKRWLFMGLSALLLLASIVTFFKPGPHLGTDFKGGTELEVAFLKPTEAGDIRAAVESLGFNAPDVIRVKDSGAEDTHRFLIRVQEVSALGEEQKEAIRQKLCILPEGTAPSAEYDARCPANARASEIKFSPGGDKVTMRYEVEPDLATIRTQLTGIQGVELRTGENNPVVVSARDHKVEAQLKSRGDQLLDGLRSKLGADRVPERALRVEWIGPKAGAQLRDAAIRSIAIAIVFIMAYIAFRFDLRFAPGGILALVHDVGIALGAMIITHREITLSTVAAMLTIVGYSITDTVVVYDRIRENLTKHRGMSFSSIINLSISEMLGRTIITSGVTALSMVCFLVWGTGVIKDFAFALLVGIVVGTYSSIYVAAPFTEWIDRRFFGGQATAQKKIARTKAVKRADAVV